MVVIKLREFLINYVKLVGLRHSKIKYIKVLSNSNEHRDFLARAGGWAAVAPQCDVAECYPADEAEQCCAGGGGGRPVLVVLDAGQHGVEAEHLHARGQGGELQERVQLVPQNLLSGDRVHAQIY